MPRKLKGIRGMRKILPICIIALLLCSASISIQVLAQNIEKKQEAGSAFDYSKLSIEKKQAIVEKAFDDYLSGKTDKLIVPGAKQGNSPIIDAKIAINYSYRPDFSNVSLGKNNDVSINTITPGETSRYTSWPCSAEWPASIVYVGAGGSASYTTSILATSVDGVIHPSALQNMQDQELFVMHLWGTGSAGENDIVFQKDPYNLNNIWVRWYLGGLNNSHGNGIEDCYVRTRSLSKDHEYSIYVKAVNPSGIYYNQVEFCVFDLTDFVWYIDPYTLTSTTSMDRADMALEQFYRESSPPGLTMQWRSVTNFHVYNQNLGRMNLLQSGYVNEYLISGVNNAYFHDFSYYFEPNAQATFYMTNTLGVFILPIHKLLKPHLRGFYI